MVEKNVNIALSRALRSLSLDSWSLWHQYMLASSQPMAESCLKVQYSVNNVPVFLTKAYVFRPAMNSQEAKRQATHPLLLWLAPRLYSNTQPLCSLAGTLWQHQQRGLCPSRVHLHGITAFTKPSVFAAGCQHSVKFSMLETWSRISCMFPCTCRITRGFRRLRLSHSCPGPWTLFKVSGVMLLYMLSKSDDIYNSRALLISRPHHFPSHGAICGISGSGSLCRRSRDERNKRFWILWWEQNINK